MQLKEIIDVINFMLGNEQFSTEKIKKYDLNNNGFIDMEDFVSMCELYAKNLTLESSLVQREFRRSIRALFKSGKLSQNEMTFVGEKLGEIHDKYDLDNKVSQSESKMFKSKRGSKFVAPQANIIEPNQS